MFFNQYSKICAILKFRCPRCYKGSFFVYNKFTIYPNRIIKIHDNCPKCNLKYMLEPSFYYGAMYIAYGLTVGFSILTFLLGHYLLRWHLLEIFILIGIMLVMTTPFTLRFSRCIWIHLFVGYDDGTQKTKST